MAKTHSFNGPICRYAPFRATETGDGFTLDGYAAVFNTPTRIDSWEGLFDEQISPGAFAKTIDERTPVLQFDHGHDIATGSVPIGAISDLGEDTRGLRVQARLFDNDRVEPIRQAIAGGAITGMSFRFRVLRDEEEQNDESGVPLRTIKEVELFELGPVVFPAYESTTVGVRTLLAARSDNASDIVRALRDVLDEFDAAHPGTSTVTPDADPAVTSGFAPHQRSHALRELTLKGLR